MRQYMYMWFLTLMACQDPPKTTINNSPSVIIQSPEQKSEFTEGDEIIFEALVSDEDQDITTVDIQWFSDQDQSLFEGYPNPDGSTDLTTSELSVGKHVIHLIAIDTENATGKDWIEVEIRELED